MADVRLSSLIAPPFWPVHQDVLANRHTHYWLKGGRGSTKSSYISLEIVLGVMRNPDANAVVYRKVAATLKESVYAQLVWAINALGVAGYWRCGVNPMELTYKPTGQKILFRGADDPNKSKSIKLAKGYFKYLWYEELTEFTSMEDVRTINQSIIRGGARVVVFYSYNPPKSAQNWTNAECLIQRTDRLVHHSTYLDVPRAWLGEPFILEAEALRQTNEAAYRHAYMGEVTGTGGQVFDNLRIEVIPDDLRQSFDRFSNGLDFGFAVDPDAFLRMHYAPHTRTLYLLDEYYATHNSMDTLAERIIGLSGRELATADSEDPRMIAELRTRGVNITGAKKGPGSVDHGMRWLQELGAIVIDPARCPNAAREFSGYEYARDKYGNFRADYPDADNHTIDAARYGTESLRASRQLGTISKSLLGL